MEEKFKVGDVVYMAYDPTIKAKVVSIDEEIWKHPISVQHEGQDWTERCCDFELLEPKTAFLTRLGDLLKEFGAKIDCRYHEIENYRGDLPCVDFGNGETLVWEEINGVTAENVMNVKNVE